MSEYMYEGMFLLDSGRFASDPDGTANGLLAILTRCGANVVASRPWQDGKLCYPINSQRKGLYYLACFKMDGGQMGELNRLCGLSDTILRQLVIRHPEVVFNAMVDALTSHDGTIHSPEQREAAARERDGRSGGDRVPEEAAAK
jgi:small subunit ribosomal protein S6